MDDSYWISAAGATCRAVRAGLWPALFANWPRRAERRAASPRCHPVGVNGFVVARFRRALPWAVEYDPVGVGDDDAVASRRVAAFSPEGARFHSEGRSPGENRPAPFVFISPEGASPAVSGDDVIPPIATPNRGRIHTPRRHALCHPVGVNGFVVARVRGALPWAVEYDPVGVGDGDAVASRRVAAFNPEGGRFHSDGRSPGKNRQRPPFVFVIPERTQPGRAIGAAPGCPRQVRGWRAPNRESAIAEFRSASR
jgi:hypothetical protein